MVNERVAVPAALQRAYNRRRTGDMKPKPPTAIPVASASGEKINTKYNKE